MIAKIRVAVLIPGYGKIDRGAENFTKGLVGYHEDKIDFFIFCRSSKSKNTKKIFCIGRENKVLMYLFSRNIKLTEILANFLITPEQIESFTFSIFVLQKLFTGKYDLVFVQNGFWGCLVARFYRFFTKKPFVYRTGGGKEPICLKQNPDLAIATQVNTYNWIKENHKRVKVCLIPNGVNRNKFTPDGPKVVLNLEHPIFLCVGEFIYTKMMWLAIEAVSALPKGSLILLGKGVMEKKLNKLGSKKLGQGRFLVKYVSYKVIQKYYRSADVFTLPSLDEPFGIVYLEALASNLPVVAPRDKSRKYIVGKAGILCDVEDKFQYAKALKKAGAEKWGEVPRIESKKFDWRKISREYLRQFKQIVI